MKKLISLTFIILTFVSGHVSGQVEAERKRSSSIEQLYVNIGLGPVATNGANMQTKAASILGSLTFSAKNTLSFRSGMYYTPFSDDLKRLSYPSTDYDNAPLHELYSSYLAIGNHKQLNRFIVISGFGGISYNRHFVPEALTYGFSTGVFGGGNYEYVLKTRHKPGLLLQGEIAFSGRLNTGAIALGIFGHLIPQASNAGISATVCFGKVGENIRK